MTPTNHHWNGGSITSVSSFLTSSSRWSSQCQQLHLNLSRSFPSPAMCSGHPQEGQVESWEGRGPCGGEVQVCNLRLLKAWASENKLLPFWLIGLIASMSTWINKNVSKIIVKFFWISISSISTFWFTNRGIHVRTTRKRQNLKLIIKRFEAVCWETAKWEKS